jgi:dephospho-CoA kinase
MILGLTGSLGSGKSTVSSHLRDLGAQIICADEIAREVVAKGSPALLDITREFGPDMLDPDGTLDRRAMARLVFADADARRKLEQIIHPRVRERELQLLATFRDSPLIVLDIPLLYETGAEDICDQVVVVAIDEVARRERLMQSRSMGPEEITARLAAQMPQEQKRERADYVIDNSGTMEQTREQVARLIEKLNIPGFPSTKH